MRALAFKELRDVFGITLAALGCYVALAVNAMGAKVFDWVPGMPRGTREVPFVGGNFTLFFCVISVLFALALGFRQSSWESAKGTYLFLLHRPLRREVIFAVKLALGLGVLLLCAAVPIVLYGTWAAIPGHHPSPFEWSMTLSTWETALLTPLLYVGAFLSGIRPARWYATRLLPLAASLLGFIVLSLWGVLGAVLGVLLCGVLITNVFYVARVRDYA
jgi:hypothetical protein